jgi:hypothetical protein
MPSKQANPKDGVALQPVFRQLGRKWMLHDEKWLTFRGLPALAKGIRQGQAS